MKEISLLKIGDAYSVKINFCHCLCKGKCGASLQDGGWWVGAAKVRQSMKLLWIDFSDKLCGVQAHS